MLKIRSTEAVHSKGKVCRIPRGVLRRCWSPFPRQWACRCISQVCDAWPVWRHTYSYLPSHKASCVLTPVPNCPSCPAPLKPRQHGTLQIWYCIVLYVMATEARMWTNCLKLLSEDRMARSQTFESRVLTTVWSGSVMELLSDKRSLWLEGLWQDVGFERGLEGWEVITRSCFHCWLPWWPWQCSIETVSPSCPLASAQTSSRRSSSSLLSENTCTHTLQWSTSVWLQCKRTQVQASLRAVVLITTAAAIYSLGHGLHILTAVPRLTQPSTPCGIAKKYQFLD